MSINNLVLGMFAAWLSIANCQVSQVQPATSDQSGGNEAKPNREQATVLHDIKNIAQLKTLFNQRKGDTRLIVLFSPT